MRIYLSNYWKKNCLLSIAIIFIIMVSTIIFCVWSHDDEDYIIIAGSLLFVFLFFYLFFLSIKLVRYVIKDKQQLVMYSFRGKSISSIRLDEEIFYEELPLIEGTYSMKDFIVLSNKPFESYRSNNFTGLAKVCREIDKNGDQVIMPYIKCNIVKKIDTYTLHKIY